MLVRQNDTVSTGWLGLLSRQRLTSSGDPRRRKDPSDRDANTLQDVIRFAYPADRNVPFLNHKAGCTG